MKIFQIYFKPELKHQCDPAFAAYDNTSNPKPELREWDVWNRFYQTMLNGSEELDMWGFVSWKFKEKTNLTGQQVLDHIAANPGYDVYLFNPCILNEAVFVNGWEQGDLHHPNISAIGNAFLAKLGYEDYDVKEVLLDRTRTIFANYLVGSRRFWDMFMEFSNQLFTAAETDPEFKHQVFGQGLSNYAHDKSLPNFTFLIERLIPTFLELNDFSVCPYTYTHDTVHEKYQPYINDILALSNLKLAVNQYESDELYTIWNHYRLRFIAENPGILGLE
jgi:hypothetical protein